MYLANTSFHSSTHFHATKQCSIYLYPFCCLLFVFVRKSFRYFHLFPSRSLCAAANDLLLYFSLFILSHPMAFRSTRYLFVILLHHRLTDIAKPYDGLERQSRESSAAPKIKRTVEPCAYIYDRLGDCVCMGKGMYIADHFTLENTVSGWPIRSALKPNIQQTARGCC